MADPNVTATFSRGPVLGWAFLNTAETGLATPSNIKLLVDGSKYPNGITVKDFTASGQGTTAADRIQLWLDPGWTQKFWWRDFNVSAAPTVDASTPHAFKYFSMEDVFHLPHNWFIWASCYGGADFLVLAHGAHYERENP